jgi:serine/threonine-protein kinase HipA
MKYEKEGGPSFAECFKVVEQVSTDPLHDTQQLIKAFIFNLVSCNADAHAKNFSLLYNKHSQIRLAPFYDMLCTRVYGRLDRLCAMSIGSSHDPGHIARQDWMLVAERIGVGKSYLLTEVEQMAENCRDQIEAAAHDFSQQWGVPANSLHVIVLAVKRQCKRTLNLLVEQKNARK